MGNAVSKVLPTRGDPYAAARDWKERTGGRVIGFFCCYAPEEIVHAAGALPVRITGENRVISLSGSHLQSYCCSLARTSLDMALDKGLDFIDGTVFVHTCDTMQRLSDIWRLNAGYPLHFDVVLPVRFEGEAAEEYMCEELYACREELAQALGPISDDAITGSIRLYNRNRELLAGLYELRRADPSVMTSDESLWLVAVSALMEKSEHNELLDEVLSDLSPSPGSGEGRDGGKIPLFAIGSVMDQWEFLETVEDLGGTFVDDDLCTGHRYFDSMAPDDPDPVKSIARRLTRRAFCPCKHLTSRDRAKEVLSRLEASGARGAVFFQFKYCEPHAFDYPYLKKALDERGVPSLLLEIEQGSVSGEQLRTRIEALLETIGG